jgi:hypothetical protein
VSPPERKVAGSNPAGRVAVSGNSTGCALAPARTPRRFRRFLLPLASFNGGRAERLAEGRRIILKVAYLAQALMLLPLLAVSGPPPPCRDLRRDVPRGDPGAGHGARESGPAAGPDATERPDGRQRRVGAVHQPGPPGRRPAGWRPPPGLGPVGHRPHRRPDFSPRRCPRHSDPAARRARRDRPDRHRNRPSPPCSRSGRPGSGSCDATASCARPC